MPITHSAPQLALALVIAGSASVVEGDRVAINWVFEFVYKSGKTGRFDEVALQEWRGDKIFRERFFYDPSRPAA